MKNLKKVFLSVAVMLTSTRLFACNRPIYPTNSDKTTEKEDKTKAKACYRLTDFGADLANNALLLKKTQRFEAIRTFKKWGVYPKEANDDVSSFDEDSTSEPTLDENEKYSENDIIDTGTEDLPLAIEFSKTKVPGLNTMFLIGNHRGDIIQDNTKKANDSDVKSSVILYPSTTLSSEQLTNYDLDASWTTDKEKQIDERKFNVEQETVINYKLVDNSGVLSTENKSAETNLHFSVVLENDQAPVGKDAIIDDISYTMPIEDIKELIIEKILGTFTSANPEAALSVKFVKGVDDLTEMTDDDFENGKTANVNDARENKGFSPWIINFVVSDSDGNSTDVQKASITFKDDVAPVIKKDGVVVNTLTLGDGKGIQLCSPKTFIAGATKLAKQEGYTFEDEIFGEVEPKFELNEDGQLDYKCTDSNGNFWKGTDASLFIKDFNTQPADDTYTPDFVNEYQKVIDGNGQRYYVMDYWNEFRVTTAPIEAVTTSDWDYESLFEYTEPKIISIVPLTVNTGTAFEEVITPTSICRNINLSGYCNDIIIINAPITINLQFTGALHSPSDGKQVTESYWISKDVTFKSQFLSSSATKNITFDFYMEDSEENSTDTTKYFSGRPGSGIGWYGSNSHKYNIRWGQKFSDFKAKFNIE